MCISLHRNHSRTYIIHMFRNNLFGFFPLRKTKSKYIQILLKWLFVKSNNTKFSQSFRWPNPNNTKYTLDTPNNPKYKYFMVIWHTKCWSLAPSLTLKQLKLVLNCKSMIKYVTLMLSIQVRLLLVISKNPAPVMVEILCSSTVSSWTSYEAIAKNKNVRY